MITATISVSPRVVARLVNRLCKPRLTPVAEAALSKERAFKRVFLAAVREAQDAIPMQDLVDVLSLGHWGTGAPLYVLQPVFDMLLEKTTRTTKHEPYVRAAAVHDETVAGIIHETMHVGAEATELCVAIPDAAAHVQSYVEGELSDRLNSSLREGVALMPDLQTAALALDSTIASSPEITRATLYRGIPRQYVTQFVEKSEYVDLGFVSTTKSSVYARQIVEDSYGDAESILLKIHVPKGTRGLDVNQLMGPPDPSLDDQQEVILARGSRFVVEKVDQATRTITLRLVRN